LETGWEKPHPQTTAAVRAVMHSLFAEAPEEELGSQGNAELFFSPCFL